MASTRKPDAVLHIGMEKTGTTTLQSTLHGNRQTLLDAGFVYSQAVGGTNHMALAAYAKTDAAIDKLRHSVGVRSQADLPLFRGRVEADLAAERAEHPDKTFLFSNEHCQSHLHSREEVQRLHDLLAPHFETIHVMLYLRRQDRVAVSRYSTRLKAGFVPDSILGTGGAQHIFYDYLGLVERWAEMFGPEQLKIGIHGPGELVDNSIVADFGARFGLPELETPAERKNVELDAVYQEYLMRMNDHLRGDDSTADGERRERLQIYIEEIGAGRGRRPARAEAEAFYDGFRARNEELRARFLPERETLFDEDFSSYQEAPEYPELDLDTALQITAAIWGRLASDNHKLRAALALARGQAYVHADRPQKAHRMLRAAVRKAPDNAQAWYLLSRASRQLGKQDEARKCAEKAAALDPESRVYKKALANLAEDSAD